MLNVIFAGITPLAGGPDGYGYRYRSTQDGDSVVMNWIEISTTGTPTGATDDWCSGYSASRLYYLGFSFPFYDGVTDSISICSNGTVILRDLSTYLGFSNYALPYTSTSAGFIAALWNDLNPNGSGADDIYFQSFSSCPDGYSGACAVVEWHNVPRFGGSLLMNFEVILYDNGNIKLQYNSAVDYGDATVGIQNSGADTLNDYYMEYVYNGNPSSHIPDSGTVIMFYYPVPIDYNVGALEVSPSGPIDVAPISFRATVENGGLVPTTSTAVILNVYDTSSSTLAFSDTQTVAIPETSTVEVTFDPFTPSPSKVYRVEVMAVEPADTVHYNDTASTYVRTVYLFGEVVRRWQFPDIGDGSGYSFAGMTYVPDSGNFYVVSLNPRGVLTFDPDDPSGTLDLSSLGLHPFFGGDDYAWGIAYGNGRFYVSHFGYDGSSITGSVIGYYDSNGNLVDSLDVWSNVESGGYMAGMDWDASTGLLWGVYGQGSNSIYKIDVAAKDTVGTFPNASGGTLLDISVFKPLNEVYYGGMHVSQIFRVSYGGTLLEADSLPLVVGMDVWPECTSPDDPIFLFVSLNDRNNTLLKVATGHTCGEMTSVAEARPSTPPSSVRVVGRTVEVEGSAVLYDASGRLVARFKDSYTLKRPGVYFVRAGGRLLKVVVR